MHLLQSILLLITVIMPSACKHGNATPSSASQDLSTAPRGKTYNDYGDYLIDVNDLLTVHVQGNKDITGQYRVSPSGYISLPLAGMVRAKGLSEMSLRDSIMIKLRPHLTGPRVSVAVTEANSYVVYFSGHVQKPGTIHLGGRTTLLQGLSLAGGWTDQKAFRVIIVRETPEGVKKRYESALDSIRLGNAYVDNFWLERGDLVIIE
ncbi:MAG TPA: polysaccharide biosynthesis/export family protein [Oligoflexus sp.]|uniref:polysaccharide biosynthesis/export family protein n=1 Tax=Oligoflexus sp. TaxID=1971216 RepID=UPI002D32E2CC|nr:polysaccharide biosynthesis/export family protein [Oligoflexus sp.]HYX33006.1 polysaccharide biosynthesis/export family protein [Oligoflexus sp.]